MEKNGGDLVLHTTKIMDWFEDDFDKWGGGRVDFIARYVTPDKRKQIEAAREPGQAGVRRLRAGS